MAYDLQDTTVHVRYASAVVTQYLMPAEYIVSMLPDIKALHGYANV